MKTEKVHTKNLKKKKNKNKKKQRERELRGGGNYQVK